MSKVDLAVWRRPARAVCQVLMTKFSCVALAAAAMKHVQQVESRSDGQLVFRSISTRHVGDAGTIWTTSEEPV
jgi:hypothetical protein